MTFTGHGTDTDGTIAAYEWTSSIAGALSTQASFSTSSLAVGTHTISFRVRDDDSTWSSPVTRSSQSGQRHLTRKRSSSTTVMPRPLRALPVHGRSPLRQIRGVKIPTDGLNSHRQRSRGGLPPQLRAITRSSCGGPTLITRTMRSFKMPLCRLPSTMPTEQPTLRLTRQGTGASGTVSRSTVLWPA